jgi:hypothetical protein
MNAALARFNCGAAAAPPAVPNGRRASASDMQALQARITAWQTQQQQLGQCAATAVGAMDQQVKSRVDVYDQHGTENQQASAAWQAATGATLSSHQ